MMRLCDWIKNWSMGCQCWHCCFVGRWVVIFFCVVGVEVVVVVPSLVDFQHSHDSRGVVVVA